MTTSNEQLPPADEGRRSSEGLGLGPERAAFARWCRENGHGELDDMLTPLDRSLRALMWPVWQGAAAAERERHRAITIAATAALEDLKQASAFLSRKSRDRAPATIEVLQAALKVLGA